MYIFLFLFLPEPGGGLAQLQDEQGGHAGISQKVIEQLGHEIGRLLYFLTFVFNENNAFTKKTIQLKNSFYKASRQI